VLALGACGEAERPPGLVVGHVDHELAVLAFHAPGAGTYSLTLESEAEGAPALRVEAEARASDAHAVRWRAGPLRAGTTYAVTVRNAEDAVQARGRVRSAPAPGAPARVRLAVASCTPSADHPVWRRIETEEPHAIVLLGDSPYIDSTDLAAQRRAHRAFLSIPSLSRMVRTTPLWSTWDDHDYGRDNGDGTLDGKENVRRAYLESRPQARYGDDGLGIYTRVRYGPVDVFLLDLRWFAGLEAAADVASGRSLLGARQRAWLEDALRRSDASFKLLCGGMVWHKKGRRSRDDWGSYPTERAALFTHLGDARITGCILLGGDVHACQHAIYEATGAGYPLHEFVISPLHERAWRGGDRRHPARRWGTVEPHVYLLLDVDSSADVATLDVMWKDGAGRALHRVRLTTDDLRAPGR
jgi:alkaline phosphatase D